MSASDWEITDLRVYEPTELDRSAIPEEWPAERNFARIRAAHKSTGRVYSDSGWITDEVYFNKAAFSLWLQSRLEELDKRLCTIS